MKTNIICCMMLCLGYSITAQTVKKDTLIKTEVINVISKYNAKIKSVKKIKQTAKVELLSNNKKKALSYSIFSVPVASTFIPTTGVVKGIDVGVKEKIYTNYIAAGYGNYNSPFAEINLYNNNRFNYEYGGQLTYNASLNNIENTLLNSTYSNLNTSLFYKSLGRYYNWQVKLNTAHNAYNWYGLPQQSTFNNTVLSGINEAQNYNYFKLSGELEFIDSLIEFATLDLSYLSDNFNSKEVFANLNTVLNIPLDGINNQLNALKINGNLEFVNGTFNSNYAQTNGLAHNFATLKIAPSYTLEYLGFRLNAGFKTFFVVDTERKASNFYIMPDVILEGALFENYVTMYAGATGNLTTNTFKSLSDQNPFVAPTLTINQTVEKQHLFAGLKGNISANFNYNVKFISKKEDNKPLFIRHNSKSDGTIATFGGTNLLGYHYGNSFNVVYDAVKTNTFILEGEYVFDKNLNIRATAQADNYTVTNTLKPWNLPTFTSTVSTNYTAYKWFANLDLFYVNQRAAATYTNTYPAAIANHTNLDSFIDVNISGGYHFTEQITGFLNVKNALNNNYQRFANFNVQGLQVMGGLTFKFDF